MQPETTNEPAPSRLSLLDRYPFNSPWIRGLVARYGLALWFALVSVPVLVGFLMHDPVLFVDAHLYVDATREWLAGGDPWTVSYAGIAFAAPPPSLVPLVPFALLPEPIGWLLLGGLCVVGAIVTIRLLDLQWWWLLFPPTVMGMMSGNVQLLLVPLLLRGVGWLAGVLKVYAIVPDVVLGHWRQLVTFAGVIVLTAPFLPWAAFLSRLEEVNAALDLQSNYGLSVSASLMLLVPALAAMWVIGRDRSAWLAVPALWPAQQWYYATLVLPARSRVAAFIVSLPLDASGTIALFALAAITLWQRRSAGRHQASAPVEPT